MVAMEMLCLLVKRLDLALTALAISRADSQADQRLNRCASAVIATWAGSYTSTMGRGLGRSRLEVAMPVTFDEVPTMRRRMRRWENDRVGCKSVGRKNSGRRVGRQVLTRDRRATVKHDTG